MSNVVLDSVKKFIGGSTNEIVDGIGGLATAALEGILGENALAFQAAKSSVNVDAITFNTFLQAYKTQLDKLNLPPGSTTSMGGSAFAAGVAAAGIAIPVGEHQSRANGFWLLIAAVALISALDELRGAHQVAGFGRSQ